MTADGRGIDHLLDSVGVHDRKIREGHAQSELHSRSWIFAGNDRMLVVAASIQTGDRVVRRIKHLRLSIRP